MSNGVYLCSCSIRISYLFWLPSDEPLWEKYVAYSLYSIHLHSVSFLAVSFCFSVIVNYQAMCVYVLIHFFCRWEESPKTRRIIHRAPRGSSSRLFESFRLCFYAKFAQCMALYVHKESVVHAEFPNDCWKMYMCPQSVHQSILL